METRLPTLWNFLATSARKTTKTAWNPARSRRRGVGKDGGGTFVTVLAVGNVLWDHWREWFWILDDSARVWRLSMFCFGGFRHYQCLQLSHVSAVFGGSSSPSLLKPCWSSGLLSQAMIVGHDPYFWHSRLLAETMARIFQAPRYTSRSEIRSVFRNFQTLVPVILHAETPKPSWRLPPLHLATLFRDPDLICQHRASKHVGLHAWHMIVLLGSFCHGYRWPLASRDLTAGRAMNIH